MLQRIIHRNYTVLLNNAYMFDISTHMTCYKKAKILRFCDDSAASVALNICP